MIELKGGFTTEDQRLDRIPSYDPRNEDYPASTLLAGVPKLRRRSWRLYAYLDQGAEGACVEFGWAHELNAQPISVPAMTLRQIVAAHDIYFPAQRIDEWPGGAYPGANPFYEGTSVLAGAKITKQLGYIDAYYWAKDGGEVAQVVSNVGPVVLGLNWHEGMSRPTKSGVIAPTGRVLGGHCVAATALKRIGDEWYIGGPNSWGRDWGDMGRWWMELSAFIELFRRRGDGCVPVGRKR